MKPKQLAQHIAEALAEIQAELEAERCPICGRPFRALVIGKRPDQLPDDLVCQGHDEVLDDGFPV